MKPGLRVLRGPDWCHGNQDGGIGCLGTVVKFFPDNTVLVTWDVGKGTVCRAGLNGAFDLRVFDNAQIGVSHGGATCDVINEEVHGIRWKCLVCDDYDECTECYMGIRTPVTHDPTHPFVRLTTKKATAVRVPLRHKSKRIPIYGIAPGAKVTKVASSRRDKEMSVGVVKEMIAMHQDSQKSYRSVVKVEWTGPNMKRKLKEDGTEDLPIYRVGADGKVELKIIEPVSRGYVFIDHLPVLDLTTPVDVDFKVGDTVRIDLNLDTFKSLQREYGGWVDALEQLLGEEGKIAEILDPRRRVVSVTYEGARMNRAVLFMNVLTKIATINSGDFVQVTNDERKMKDLQVGHGGWQQAYISILGKTGHVVRIDESKDALVDIGGDTFVLNPACLIVKPEPVHKNKYPTVQNKPLNKSGSLRSMSFYCPVPVAARRRKPFPGKKVKYFLDNILFIVSEVYLKDDL